MSTPSENTVPSGDETVKTAQALDLGYWSDLIELIADRDDTDLGRWIENDLRELEDGLSQFVSPSSLRKHR